MRRSAVLAWALAAVGAVLILAYEPFLFLTRDAPPPPTFGSFIADAIATIIFVAFPLVGGLIASRHPRNSIGWIFLAMALVVGVIELDRGYAIYALYVSSPPAPLGLWAAWAQNWAYVPGLSLLGFVLLLFPDGHFPSPRWRWMVAVAIVGGILEGGSNALLTGTNPDFRGLTNPIALDAPWLGVTAPIGTLVNVGFIVAAGAAAVARGRRSRGVERQQMKWFAFAGAFNLIALPLSTATYGLERNTLTSLIQLLPAASVSAIPIAAAIAILRYRLYDIDVVIERTLVYGSLTATIAATYIALVVLLQSALRPLTSGSEIAVAGSTLASLALIQPLRRRIQSAVDRRFYRARYDAGRVLDTFTGRLRKETDLDSVKEDVLDVVAMTVSPAHAGVWLRRST